MSERQRGKGKNRTRAKNLEREAWNEIWHYFFFCSGGICIPFFTSLDWPTFFSSHPSSSLELMLPCPLFCGGYIWLITVITSHIYTREIPARIIFLYEFCGHLYSKMKEQTFNHGRLGFCGPNGIGHLDVCLLLRNRRSLLSWKYYSNLTSFFYISSNILNNIFISEKLSFLSPFRLWWSDHNDRKMSFFSSLCRRRFILYFHVRP